MDEYLNRALIRRPQKHVELHLRILDPKSLIAGLLVWTLVFSAPIGSALANPLPSPQLQPILVKVIDLLAGYLFGKGVDYAIDQMTARKRITEDMQRGVIEIRDLRSHPQLSEEDRELLSDFSRKLNSVIEILGDLNLDDAEARARITRVMNYDFDALESRVSAMYDRLSGLERFRDEQNERNRHQESFNRGVDKRLVTIEDELWLSDVQFQRNKYALSAGYRYSVSRETESARGQGFQGILQFNFARHFGIFVEVDYEVLDASRSAGFPGDSILVEEQGEEYFVSRSTGLEWRNWSAQMGFNWNVLSPGNTVSFQLGVGAGMGTRRFYHLYEDGGYRQGAEKEYDGGVNLVASAHADLSFQFGSNAKVKPYLMACYSYSHYPLDQSEWDFRGALGHRFYVAAAGLRILLTD
jgi:hypothetical protein